MEHHLLAASNRLAAGILFGVRLALIVASLGVVKIFWSSAKNHFSPSRRRLVFADQLGAGIWLTAAGLIFGELTRLALNYFFPSALIDAFVIPFSITMIIAGYLMHFQAMAAATRPDKPALAREWMFCVVGAAIVGLVLKLL